MNYNTSNWMVRAFCLTALMLLIGTLDVYPIPGRAHQDMYLTLTESPGYSKLLSNIDDGGYRSNAINVFRARFVGFSLDLSSQ